MSIVREIRDLMSRVSRVEQQVSKLPSRISSAVGGSGGGSGWEPYVVETREELPVDPPDGSLGYVTSGTYEGGWFSYGIDGWVGLNFWEQGLP